MTTYDGKPVEFIITPASTADITAFKRMEIDPPLDASMEIKHTLNIRLRTTCKNLKKLDGLQIGRQTPQGNILAVFNICRVS